MKQQINEPVNSFVTKLRAQANKCKYGSPANIDNQILDQLIKGVANVSVRKKYFYADPSILTLDKAIDFA